MYNKYNKPHIFHNRKMIQSAETIPHFNMDRFDRHWNKFVENRNREERSATMDRRILRAKNRRYHIYHIYLG